MAASPRTGSRAALGPDTPRSALAGYARISTADQNLNRQIQALKDAGCIHIFADKMPGKTLARPELEACLDYLQPGDTLVVPSLDRLSRSLQDLIILVSGYAAASWGFGPCMKPSTRPLPAAA